MLLQLQNVASILGHFFSQVANFILQHSQHIDGSRVPGLAATAADGGGVVTALVSRTNSHVNGGRGVIAVT